MIRAWMEERRLRKKLRRLVWEISPEGQYHRACQAWASWVRRL